MKVARCLPSASWAVRVTTSRTPAWVRAGRTISSRWGDLCRQREGDLVIDHDDDLEALAVRGDKTLDAFLGHDGRPSLVHRVVPSFLENKERPSATVAPSSRSPTRSFSSRRNSSGSR
jgi:hypothetical protein